MQLRVEFSRAKKHFMMLHPRDEKFGSVKCYGLMGEMGGHNSYPQRQLNSLIRYSYATELRDSGSRTGNDYRNGKIGVGRSTPKNGVHLELLSA